MSTDWHLFSAACTKESACEFMACLGTHDYGGVRALSLGTGQRVYGPNTQYWHIHPERGAQSQCQILGHFGSRAEPLHFSHPPSLLEGEGVLEGLVGSLATDLTQFGTSSQQHAQKSPHGYASWQA